MVFPEKAEVLFKQPDSLFVKGELKKGARTSQWSSEQSLTNDYSDWESAGVMYELIFCL